MGTITTLRPSATASATGWTALPSGTPHGVTSDDSDSTYVLWLGSGTALALATPLDAPPAGERRHQVRIRARGSDGDAWWGVRLATGAIVAGASAQFTASPSTVIGSWGTGVPPTGSIVLQAYVDGQTSGLEIQELYLDVDTRLAPTLAAQVADGSGAVTTNVTDTATPTVRATAVDLDGLLPRQFRYWVTQGSTIVWDSGVTSGPAGDLLTDPLANGAYTLHVQVWSTLGANTAYASEIETVDFTVSVGLVPRPQNPTVTAVAGTPFFEIEACAPYVGDFDGEAGYVEIQRVDCPVDGVPTAITTIAILGPLGADECATWVDYSIPRSGIGGTCDHDPYECCSYYRARTVGRIDGSITVSQWSDVEDTGVPSGIIVMWPSTAASVPLGWNRVTDLDGRYIKGVATAGTQPGALGGAASHVHDATHSHDTSHTHATSGATSAAVGSASSHDGAAGTLAIAASHTHTVPNPTASATISSGATSPAIGSVNNELDRLDVVYISSGGTAEGVPDGALGFSGDVSITGWTDYSDAANRFPKGAAPGGDGGATGSGTLSNHTHSIAAHTHTGTSHTHPSGVTNTAASNITLFAGPTSVLWQNNHTHPVTYGNTTSGALASGGSGTSNATSRGTDQDPPYRNLRVKENTSGVPDLPIGLICAWRGSLGSIPDNWQLCDGTNGTPDMLGRYPRGATASIGTAGGSSATHSHTATAHTHTTTGHSHTMAIPSSGAGSTNTSATVTLSVATGAHTHTHADTASTTPTVGSASANLADIGTEPLHGEVAFVQLMSDPVPPPDPDVVCLTWDADEGLIRTRDAGGALWARVKGRFTWGADRPFTSEMGVDGNRFVISAPPGGRNLSMTAAVESESELDELKAVLNRPLVLISPADSSEVWAAPVSHSVRVVKIDRIRQVTAEFIATGPEPAPQLADLGE